MAFSSWFAESQRGGGSAAWAFFHHRWLGPLARARGSSSGTGGSCQVSSKGCVAAGTDEDECLGGLHGQGRQRAEGHEVAPAGLHGGEVHPAHLEARREGGPGRAD